MLAGDVSSLTRLFLNRNSDSARLNGRRAAVGPRKNRTCDLRFRKPMRTTRGLAQLGAVGDAHTPLVISADE